MARIDIEDPITKEEITYYMDDRLKKNIDDSIIPSLKVKDKDRVIVIDGNEGGGKSTLAIQIGKYVDPTLTLDRICFSPDEFRTAIFRAGKKQCVIYDEAFTGLSSRSALSRINRMLVSLMMQMRQKNLFVIVVLPTIYMLDKYVAIFRTRFLIHIYENKGIRGYFLVFNKRNKKLLFKDGKKDFTYPIRTNFRGRFYGVFALGKQEEDEYREKKANALESIETADGLEEESRFRVERKTALVNLSLLMKKVYNLKFTEICERLKTVGFNIDNTNLSKMMAEAKKKRKLLLFED